MQETVLLEIVAGIILGSLPSYVIPEWTRIYGPHISISNYDIVSSKATQHTK